MGAKRKRGKTKERQSTTTTKTKRQEKDWKPWKQQPKWNNHSCFVRHPSSFIVLYRLPLPSPFVPSTPYYIRKSVVYVIRLSLTPTNVSCASIHSFHPFNHSTIQSFNHSTAQPLNRSTIRVSIHTSRLCTSPKLNHQTLFPLRDR